MLTVAYCRVSTEEQAPEGFSIEGQADRLRAYAELHDLGDVLVVADPGWSGKDTNRPGLQRVLAMVEAGHLANVVVWRLDRLSRNLGDLILLADMFGQAGVSLHSFTEKLDLSSATGRMFYNVLGSFAQFYREQLGENVTMGTERAMREGRWCNRPPTGYDLHDGLLIPNSDAPRVQAVFRLRAEGLSHREISERTGIGYSTIVNILRNQAYLGQMPRNGDWWPGRHEPLVTPTEFEAAHKGRTPNRRRGKDLMSGRVLCGSCGRHMAIQQNGKGQAQYRCRHRGDGCDLPARSNRGILAAARLGLTLLYDQSLRDDVRRGTERLTELRQQQRKLLALHYDDQISGALFAEEQGRIAIEIETLEADANRDAVARLEANDLTHQFDQLVATLDQVDLGQLWAHATEAEHRTLLDELLQSVTIHDDRLVVSVHGAPPLNVTYSEVGLKAPHSEIGGVGGPT